MIESQDKELLNNDDDDNAEEEEEDDELSITFGVPMVHIRDVGSSGRGRLHVRERIGSSFF